MVTVVQPTESAALPAGLLVHGTADEIARHFLALAPLQPVTRTSMGLLCAPRAAPELAAAALSRCPLPVEKLAQVPGWPDPPADAVAGWYRRGPDHAPAPAGVGELIQPPGEGFGPLGHATTAMCLRLMAHMPCGPALDAGCGSGLLAQAWAASGRGAVIGYDLDPRALSQARAGIVLAGLVDRVDLRPGALETIAPTDLAGRVLLANVPAPAHLALAARAARAPHGAVLSGLRAQQMPAVLAAWSARGMRVVRTALAGGFCAVALRPA